MRTIAILQMTGGALSICFITWSLVTQVPNISSGIIGIAELLIDIAAVVAGISLWRGTSFGRMASLAIQFIQLPKITSSAMVFLFSFGFDVWIHGSLSGVVGIQFSLFNNQLFLNVQNAASGFGISITAVIALIILKKYEPKPRTAGPLPRRHQLIGLTNGHLTRRWTGAPIEWLALCLVAKVEWWYAAPASFPSNSFGSTMGLV